MVRTAEEKAIILTALDAQIREAQLLLKKLNDLRDKEAREPVGDEPRAKGGRPPKSGLTIKGAILAVLQETRRAMRPVEISDHSSYTLRKSSVGPTLAKMLAGHEVERDAEGRYALPAAMLAEMETH